MSAASKQLQEALCQYTTDTLTYINTVKGFCEGFSTWKDAREKELSRLNEIKDKAETKGKSLKKYMMSMVSADKKPKELQKELTAVLEDTLEGLKELNRFLEAVEKLAVTSLHVFMEENQVLHLPGRISLERVQNVIMFARLICPRLLMFKRDASVFFLPKLQNVEVLSYQLDKYIKTTRIICEELEKSILYWWMGNKPLIDLDVGLSEDKIRGMLSHINQLNSIRMDPDFRLVFLFQDVSCSGFIDEFKKRHPGMLQFLTDLEEVAVQLDKMNKGARISSVTGSSVRAVGAALSTVGLALMPVTGGVSVVLTIGGGVLEITSNINCAVTTAAEIGVNRTQQQKASEVFQRFMEGVQSLQGCLEKVRSQPASNIQLEAAHGKFFDMGSAAVSAGTGINCLAQNAPASESFISEALHTSAREVAMGSLDIGVNAIFSGMNVISICKDSYSLHKGSETEISKFIRTRAALWSSEMDSWKKIHDSLCEGQKTSEEHRAVLERTFYPERAIKKNESLCIVLPTSKNEIAVLDNPSDPEKEIKKNESLCIVLPTSKNEIAVLDNPSDPEKEIKKNESLSNVLPTLKNEIAVLDNPSYPEKEVKRKESFQMRMVNSLWMENKIVVCIVIAAIAVVATLINSH